MGKLRRRTAVVAALGVLGLSLGLSATAPADLQDLRNYQGGSRGDSNAYIEFDAVEGASRIVRVVRLRFARVDVDCKYGDDSVGNYGYKRGFNVGPAGSFRGTERARYGKLVITARIRGEFSANEQSANGKIILLTNGDKCKARWQAQYKPVNLP